MKYLLVCLISLISLSVSSAQLDFPHSEDSTILTNDIENIIGEGVGGDGEPIREGAESIAEGLNGIINEPIDSTQTAWDRTSSLITNIVNYALAITGLIALVYLLYHGFIALTARDDSEQLDKGIQGIKYAAIALVGMGVAWFVISLILWLITLITT